MLDIIFSALAIIEWMANLLGRLLTAQEEHAQSECLF